MGEVKVWSHNVSLTFYRLTSLSFHVNRPSHSWDTTFSKFDLENPRSRSWKRWTLKVTTCIWVQHSIDSHPFRSMSIGHPIHNIGPTFYWLTSLSSHVNQASHSWDTNFSKFDFEKWKSKVKVMVMVKVESHKVGVASYRLTSLSFHVNRPSHSWDTAYSKFDLENPRSRSWVWWTLKVTTWYQNSLTEVYSVEGLPLGKAASTNYIPYHSQASGEEGAQQIHNLIEDIIHSRKIPTLESKIMLHIPVFILKKIPIQYSRSWICCFIDNSPFNPEVNWFYSCLYIFWKLKKWKKNTKFFRSGGSHLGKFARGSNLALFF